MDKEFKNFLEANGYDPIEEISEDIWTGVARLLFHYTLHIGTMGDRNGYEDRYCFDTKERAVVALEDWKERGFKDEPLYWHRHPATGRRRIPGDIDDENQTINF